AEQGWRVFLVKVENPTGLDGVELRVESPNSLPLTVRSTNRPDPKVVSVGEVGKRFLELLIMRSQPLLRDLSGLELEYRVLQIYCRDAGRKEMQLGFELYRNAPDGRGLGTRLATSNRVTFVAESVPAVLVKLQVRDHNGRPTTGSFVVRDRLGLVYPSMSRRLAPDFAFHPQIYRRDGETVALQPGKYTVTYTRGPEYVVQKREITVPPSAQHTESFQ